MLISERTNGNTDANHLEKTRLLTLNSKREWLKGRLREEHSSFAQVARELGVTPSAVTHAVSGRHKSQMIIEALAKRVGVDPEKIAPSDEGGAHPNKKL